MIKGLLAHEKLFDKEDLEAIRKVCELFDRGPNLVKGICNMPDKSTGPIGMGVEEIISQTQSQFAFFKADELVKKVSNKYTSLIGATHCTYTKGKSHFPHTDRLGIGGKSVIGAAYYCFWGIRRG